MEKRYTTLQINKELHRELKEYCKKRGFKISGLVETIIKNKITPSRSNEKVLKVKR